MKPIIQLEQRLIDKIAAGEVVERPLSVVKELTENAIDAGAGRVTVEITDGGLTTVRVTDNGAGIPAEQLPLAFARHATSKITKADDLFAVATLGFRGEALSSIAAVAQVEMFTKTQQALTGTRTEVHGGKFITQQEIGCANGTTVVVSNLFYNVPPRRKFLKKPATEAGYIADCLQKLALGNPNLSIRYINNNQIIFQTNGNGDLRAAMLNIYGREVASKLLTVDAQTHGNAPAPNPMSLTGLLGKPELARGNRNHGTFFINGRYIQSRLLTHAVEAAYKTLIPGGKFPVYALSLTLPPNALDVNVHPTKMDVRFANEEAVSTFIQGALEETLSNNNLIPTAKLNRTPLKERELDQISLGDTQDTLALRKARETRVIDDTGNAPNYYKAQTTPEAAESFSVQENRREYTSNNNQEPPGGKNFNPPSSRLDRDTSTRASDFHSAREGEISRAGSQNSYEKTPRNFFHNYHLLGLLFNTYWLLTQEESLYLIDQHAAHERILYENLLQAANREQVHAQPLLIPQPLTLTPRETQTLRDNEAHFTYLGFELSPENEPALAAVPFLFKGPVSGDFFMELLDKLADTTNEDNIYANKTELIAMTACKAAVKAGDPLTEPEARELIQQLLHLENPFTCPHGRPTTIEITRRELERRFKRS